MDTSCRPIHPAPCECPSGRRRNKECRSAHLLRSVHDAELEAARADWSGIAPRMRLFFPLERKRHPRTSGAQRGCHVESRGVGEKTSSSKNKRHGDSSTTLGMTAFESAA